MKKTCLFLISLFLLHSGFVCASEITGDLSLKLKSISSADNISVIIHMKDSASFDLETMGISQTSSYLKSFSNRSQKSLINYLSSGKSNKNVLNYTSFWTFNGVALTAKKSVINELAKRTDIDTIELNRKFNLPEDPEANLVQPLITLAGTVEPNLDQIRATEVWIGYNFKGAGVKVGIADSGILDTHPDLLGKIIKEASFDDLGNKITDTATDENGHGTHVAGIIVGGNSSGSYIGVAPDAGLLIANVFNSSQESTMAQTLGGIEWLIGNGAKIVNLSLGGSPEGEVDPGWKSYVDAWTSLGVLIVAAAGNDGPNSKTTVNPANVANAMAVGAVDSSDLVANFSSRGPVIFSGTSYIKPEICAPGRSIRSSWKDGAYKIESGTSMATPHVAGVAALVLQANNTLSPSAIKRILKDNTNLRSDVTYPNNDYGWGRVDAFSAVTSAMSPDTNPPVITHTAITSAIFDTPITITATVTDDVTATPSVSLFYTDIFNVWQKITMEASASKFTAAIPSSYAKTNLNYYIEAKDLSKNTSTSPNDAPNISYAIAIASQDSISITQNQSYPNPYLPSAGKLMFSFYLSGAADITVKVYKITGEIVKVFNISGKLGYNNFDWDGIAENADALSNGVYTYQVKAKDASGNTSSSKGKIIVLR